MRTKIKTSVSIDSTLLKLADTIAEHEDRSRSYIINRILQRGLEQAALRIAQKRVWEPSLNVLQ